MGIDDGHGDLPPEFGEESLDGMLKAFFGGQPGDEAESVLHAIGELSGQKPEVLLRDLPEEHSPLMRTPSREGPEAVADDSRYQLLGEIARGGVGVVYKARDRDLGRSVALKVLRSDHADNPDVVRRFVEEAQIEGQLQHPGVVPLYGLGLQPDGRPCFAMKLVKGQTLSARLQGRADPSEDRAALLSIFERMCQAVAYAHARGVIHRDLKPLNVMTGAFGEVQVLDWGFAKVLGRGEERETTAPPQTIIATVRSGEEGSQSVAGSVMGTPSYMPPEQAMGRVEDLDERTDVFGLGAILTEMLTGLPPYTGEPKDLLMMAAHARQEEARERLDGCGADEALVDLAKRCLDPLMSKRPANAGAVAEEVHRHLAAAEESARLAEIRAAKESARREEERARLAAKKLEVKRLRAAAAEEKTAAERQRREVAKEARQARSERTKRRAALIAAVALLVAAILGGVGWFKVRSDAAARIREVEDRVTRSLQAAEESAGRADWGTAAEAARTAVDLARDAGEGTRARAASLMGRIEAGKAAADAAAAQKTRDRAMVAGLEAARFARTGGVSKDEDGKVRGSSWNNALSDRAFSAAFREYGIDVESMAPEEAAALVMSSAIRNELVGALDHWAWLISSKEELDRERSIRIAAVAKGSDPDELHGEIMDAIVSLDRERMERLAKRLIGRSVAPRLLDLLASALTDDVNFSGRSSYQLSARLLEEAVRRAPRDLWIHHHLALSLFSSGEPEAALPHRQIAVSISPQSAPLWAALALVLRETGKLEDADAAGRRALALDEGCLNAYLVLGMVESARENPEGALRWASEASRRFPDRGEPLHNMGSYHLALGDEDEALRCDREAARVAPDQGQNHHTLAWMLNQRGEHEEAVIHAKKAVALMPRHLGAYSHLATAYTGLHQYEKALKTTEQAVAIAPENPNTRIFHARALLTMGRFGDAETEAGKALDLDPENVLGLHVFLQLHLSRGKLPDALAVQKRSVRLLPISVQYFNLGVIHQALCDYPRSLTAFDEAIRLYAEDPESHGARALTLRNMGRFEESLEGYQRALDLDRESLNARRGLGYLAVEQGRAEDLLAHMEHALSREPSSTRDWIGKGTALILLGRFGEGVAAFRRALELDDELGFSQEGKFDPKVRGDYERILELWAPAARFEDRLEEIASGELEPEGPSQAYTFALMCVFTDRHEAADRFIRIALVGNPTLLLEDQNTEWAACAAVGTRTREGRDRALDWLRTFLEHQDRRLAEADVSTLVPIRDNLWRIRRNHLLSPVRDGIDILPEEEQEPWRAFWRDLHALLRKSLEKEI